MKELFTDGLALSTLIGEQLRFGEFNEPGAAVMVQTADTCAV